MAIVCADSTPNVPVRLIREVFDRDFPDREALSKSSGWSLDDIATIDLYENSDDVYCFPIEAQFASVVPPAFAPIPVLARRHLRAGRAVPAADHGAPTMTSRAMLASLVRSDVAGIVWPPLSSGASASLAALLLHLDATQWMAPAQLAVEQHRQLVVLAEHVARQSPYFRRMLVGAHMHPRDLATPEGLRQLPLLRRRDLQSAGRELYCTNVPASHLPVEETHTSGSTGEPVVVMRTAVDQLFWAALTIRDHLWHERDFSRGFSAIRATIQAYSRVASWGPPVSLLFATGPSQRIPITTSVEQQLDWLREFTPDNLMIYPASLEALARHCQQQHAGLPGLNHIRTIGETLPPAVRALAQEVLGAKVEDLYSSQEMGIIAIECPSGLYHVMAEAVIVEVLDEAGGPCKDGEIGRVVVTALHNFATPLIRYEMRRLCGGRRSLSVWPGAADPATDPRP